MEPQAETGEIMAVAKGAGRPLSLVLFIIVALASGWLGVGLDSLLTDQPEGGMLGMALWLVLPFCSPGAAI